MLMRMSTAKWKAATIGPRSKLSKERPNVRPSLMTDSQLGIVGLKAAANADAEPEWYARVGSLKA